MSETIRASLGFALAQLCKAHRYSVDSALREQGLRAGQEMLLLELWDEDGVTQTGLSERLCVEPPTTSRMLQRMEAEELIVRRPDQDDARVSRVYLTERGRALEDRVAAAWADVEGRLIAGLSAEERMLLRRLLIALRENLAETDA